jgi:hypothetical protein
VSRELQRIAGCLTHMQSSLKGTSCIEGPVSTWRRGTTNVQSAPRGQGVRFRNPNTGLIADTMRLGARRPALGHLFRERHNPRTTCRGLPWQTRGAFRTPGGWWKPDDRRGWCIWRARELLKIAARFESQCRWVLWRSAARPWAAPRPTTLVPGPETGEMEVGSNRHDDSTLRPIARAIPPNW